MMLPFQILGIWFRGLLALAIIAGGMYLLTRWYNEAHVTVPAPAVRAAADPNRPVDPADERASQNREGQPAAPAKRRFEFHPGINKSTALLTSALALLVWASLGGLIGQGVMNLTKAKPESAVSGPTDSRRARPKLGRSGRTTSRGKGRPGSRSDPRVGGVTDSPREERTGEVHTIDRPDGSQIRVECYGPPTAPPIVFTHGWGGNSTSFFYPKLDLATKFRLIVWDEPGLGLSKKPANNDYRLEKMAADLHAVLAFAGGKPAVLVGHSIGGMIILTFCRMYHETLRSQVAGLALVHTTYKDPVQTTKGATIYTLLEKPLLAPLMYVTIGLWPVFWALTWLSYLNGSLHRSTAKSSFAGTETKDQLNFCTSLTPHARPDIVARGMLGMMAYDETANLSRIDLPVLVVVGDKDTTTPPEAGQYMAQTIPGAELATLSPARHMGLIEQHQAFDPLLARFSTACFAARKATRAKP